MVPSQGIEPRSGAPQAPVLSVGPQRRGATERDRTADLRLTMATLYRLSYGGLPCSQPGVRAQAALRHAGWAMALARAARRACRTPEQGSGRMEAPEGFQPSCTALQAGFWAGSKHGA